MALVPFGQVRLSLEKLVPTWAKPFTDALGFWVVLLGASYLGRVQWITHFERLLTVLLVDVHSALHLVIVG